MKINLLDLIKEGKVKKGSHKIKVPINKANGENYDGQTYMIPLDNLYYNDENGRVIISKYDEINRGGGDLKPGHSKEYNDIMQNMLSKDHNGRTTEEMTKLKKDIKQKGQQEPGYVLLDGRVIDGNRRLTALRLLDQDPNEVQQQYYEAVILDDLSNEDKNDRANIKSLELQIQHGRLGKVDYHAVDKAIDAYKTIEIDQTLTVKEYARYAGLTENNIQNMILEAELIIKFLNFVNANETNYALARELELDGPLQEIRPKYKNFKEQENAEELLNALFTKIIQIRIEGEDFKKDYRSIRKGILGTDKEEEFVKKMEASAETIMESLEDYGKVDNFDDIKQAFEVNEDSKEAIKGVEEISTEFAQEVSNKEMMDEPLKLINRAYNTVQSIDKEVINHLSGEDREEFFKKVRNITMIFNGLGVYK